MKSLFKPVIDQYWKRLEDELWWIESDDSPRFVPINLVLMLVPTLVVLVIGYVTIFCWLNELATEEYVESVRYGQTARQPIRDWHAVSGKASKNQGAPSSPPGVIGAARGLAPGR